MKLANQFRGKALLKSEGGGSNRGGIFGAESTQKKMRVPQRKGQTSEESFCKHEEKSQGT